MFDDAADVIERRFGKIGIAGSGKLRLAIFPDGLVHVHAGAIVFKDGLGHEGRGLAISVSNLMHDVFIKLHPVGHGHEG